MGLYQPEYRDAKGVIRKSPTWWARYGARGDDHEMLHIEGMRRICGCECCEFEGEYDVK